MKNKTITAFDVCVDNIEQFLLFAAGEPSKKIANARIGGTEWCYRGDNITIKINIQNQLWVAFQNKNKIDGGRTNSSLKRLLKNFGYSDAEANTRVFKFADKIREKEAEAA